MGVHFLTVKQVEEVPGHKIIKWLLHTIMFHCFLLFFRSG